MNEQDNIELTPELAALDAGLAQLGAAERAAAPAQLEGRIVASTEGLLRPRVVHAPVAGRAPHGGWLLKRLGGKRLDWPMRVAAVICVMIGGWAVFHGIGGVKTEGGKPPLDGKAEAERMLAIWSTIDNGGTAEKIQGLLKDAKSLEELLGSDDLAPDLSDQESL